MNVQGRHGLTRHLQLQWHTSLSLGMMALPPGGQNTEAGDPSVHPSIHPSIHPSARGYGVRMSSAFRKALPWEERRGRGAVIGNAGMWDGFDPSECCAGMSSAYLIDLFRVRVELMIVIVPPEWALFLILSLSLSLFLSLSLPQSLSLPPSLSLSRSHTHIHTHCLRFVLCVLSHRKATISQKQISVFQFMEGERKEHRVPIVCVRCCRNCLVLGLSHSHYSTGIRNQL